MNKAPDRGQLNNNGNYLNVCKEIYTNMYFLNPNLQFYIRSVNGLLLPAICNFGELYRSLQHEALVPCVCPAGSSQLHV